MSTPSGADSSDFFKMVDRLEIDPATRVDPRNEILYTAGARACSDCGCKAECRAMVARGNVSLRDLTGRCPNYDILCELLHRGLPRCAA